MNHSPDDIEILLSLDSDDLPCHRAPHPRCRCDISARHVVQGGWAASRVRADDATHVYMTPCHRLVTH
jgi:hypothetical protein